MNRIVVGLAGLVAIAVAIGGAHASAGKVGPSRGTLVQGAYYDDHYGPFYDGYWTAAGAYYYSTGPARPYARDDGRHFRRMTTAGFRPVESLAEASSGGATAAR